MTRPYDGPSESALRALLARAECLLLDFDGPICRLFSGYPAAAIAETMTEHARKQGGPDALPLAGTDPHAMLRTPMRAELAADLELLLAEAEVVAARTAKPTPLADRFIRSAAAGGRRLAITSNNAPLAVETYLERHDLDIYFQGRVFGRDTKDPALMKPHPDCLLRALDALDVRPGQALMIGDSAPDAAAAKAAGVPFLGYARSPDRVARLRTVDPHPVVVGMQVLVAAVEDVAAPSN